MLKSKGGKIIDKILDYNYTLYIIIAIGIIIGILLAFNIIDYTPASESDYKPLLEVQEDIIKDFNNVYKYSNTDIDILESNISVYVDNKDCSLKIVFDREKNYMYTVNHDKAANIFIFILGILAFGFGSFGGIFLIFLFSMFGLQSFFEWLYKLKEKKTKKKITNISGDVEH